MQIARSQGPRGAHNGPIEIRYPVEGDRRDPKRRVSVFSSGLRKKKKKKPHRTSLALVNKQAASCELQLTCASSLPVRLANTREQSIRTRSVPSLSLDNLGVPAEVVAIKVSSLSS